MTSPVYLGLLDDIREFPKDDFPRLVLADYLEDSGETRRADFIRRGLEAAPQRYGCGHRNPGPFDFFDCPKRLVPGGDWTWEWQRGFIDLVACPLEEWMAYGPTVVRFHPVQSVLTERQPLRVTAGWGWVRGWPRHPANLPKPIWDALVRHHFYYFLDGRHQIHGFRSSEPYRPDDDREELDRTACREALSSALVRWAVAKATGKPIRRW